MLVGTSGLEPPTSRLSGVRSNHLSYAPVISLSKPSAFKLISCEIFVNKNSPDPSPAFGFFGVSRFSLMLSLLSK